MLFSIRVLAFKSYLSGKDRLIVPLEKLSKEICVYLKTNRNRVSG
jgi:hypothetical protein